MASGNMHLLMSLHTVTFDPLSLRSHKTAFDFYLLISPKRKEQKERNPVQSETFETCECVARV